MKIFLLRLKFFKSILCMWEFCLHHLCAWCFQRPEEDGRSLGIRITDGCEPLCGCWESEQGLLEKQPVFGTAQPSLQPKLHFYFLTVCTFVFVLAHADDYEVKTLFQAVCVQLWTRVCQRFILTKGQVLPVRVDTSSTGTAQKYLPHCQSHASTCSTQTTSLQAAGLSVF